MSVEDSRIWWNALAKRHRGELQSLLWNGTVFGDFEQGPIRSQRTPKDWATSG